MDPKRLVERGYDRIGAGYERWSQTAVTDRARERYTQALLDGLMEGAAVLDLGCGCGALLTRRLAERFSVTGVDLSSRMIALAEHNVPAAEFIKADMAAVDFPAGSFDGVCAFYSLTHLPPEELPLVLRSVAAWLRPGGLFVASLGTSEDPGGVEDWIEGVPMYFAGYAAEENKELLRGAGLRVESATPETSREEEESVTFPWVVARKPESP